MLSQISRQVLNIALAFGLGALALQAMQFDGRAEMIRPGEEEFEDLAPPQATSEAPKQDENETAKPEAAAEEAQPPQTKASAKEPEASKQEPQEAVAEKASEPEPDPDEGKFWEGPWLTREVAAAPRPRGQAIAAAQLGALSKSPHSIDALATTPSADPLLKDLRFWRTARYGKNNDWSRISGFLARRSDWPSLKKLRVAAERAMPESLADQEKIDFFSDRKPYTARGARLLGEAMIALGQGEKGEALIVEAWRSLPATSAEEGVYLKTHGALLKEHHAVRFETLLWRRDLSAAKRLTKLLPQGFDKLIEAVSSLYRRRKGVDQKVAAVPAALKDHPSLNHARMVWREKRRRRKDAEAALKEADAAGNLGAASAWAKLRMRFARDAYEDGRHQEAAEMSEGHQLSEGVNFAELEWFAGWMRLKRLNDPKAALKHFASLWKGVETPISRSRAAYWAAEAAEAAGDAAAAKHWRERAAGIASAFYGQMAAQKLGQAPELEDAEAAQAEFALGDLPQAEQDVVAAADLLYAAGLQSEGRMFMKALAEDRSDPASLGFLARRANAQGDLYAEIVVAQRAYELGAPIWSSLFPIPTSPRFAGRRVEPALLLAIARQESRFMRSARSGVGALGLMQMMPATARAAARQLKIPFEKDRLSDDWGYNLSLSDAHMSGVLERYKGSYVLSIAAYNAGEGNVDKWIKRFGDPRDKKVDTVTWIESIPFGETRNYVQRVLEAVQIYRMRLGAAQDLALIDDMNR